MVKTGNRRLDDDLREVVRRITEVANPSRILLFGSISTGRPGPDSDIDLMVVMKGHVHRRKIAQEIYHHLIGIQTPVDIIVVTSTDVEQHSERVGSVIGQALKEGIEVYAA
jgi:predicted nucleotidyltransferase